MAQIPTTNIRLGANIRNEYGGNPTNISLSNYYRFVSNAALVDNSTIVPFDPRFYFNTAYTPSSTGSGAGGSTNYAKLTSFFVNVNNQYVANTNISRQWRYGNSQPFATTTTVNDPYDNPAAPGAYYGDPNNYFYFTPDTNYPWSGQTRSIQSMFIASQYTAGTGYVTGLYLYQVYTALWVTQAKEAYQALINQTIPQNGASDISFGNFKGQQNP